MKFLDSVGPIAIKMNMRKGDLSHRSKMCHSTVVMIIYLEIWIFSEVIVQTAGLSCSWLAIEVQTQR